MVVEGIRSIEFALSAIEKSVGSDPAAAQDAAKQMETIVGRISELKQADGGTGSRALTRQSSGRSLEIILHERAASDTKKTLSTCAAPLYSYLDHFFLFIGMLFIISGWGAGAPAFVACVAVAVGYHFMSRHEHSFLQSLGEIELTPEQVQQKREKIFKFCRSWFFRLLCSFGGYCFLVAWVLGAMFAFNLMMQLYGAMRCALDKGCQQQVQDDWGLWWVLMVLMATFIPTLITQLFSTGWIMICRCVYRSGVRVV
jgi:hypothetical protein